jgi:hypothetical protein
MIGDERLAHLARFSSPGSTQALLAQEVIEVRKLDKYRAPCPTCNGVSTECDMCGDGRVPLENLVAIGAAVMSMHPEEVSREGVWSFIEWLRTVKP